MRIETSFSVRAPARRVHEFLVDLDRLAGCVPGAALFGLDEAGASRGGLRIEAGDVAAAAEGAIRVSAQDAAIRSATLHAEGREAGGTGSARVKLFTAVTPESESSSTVRLITEVTASGWSAPADPAGLERAARDLLAEVGTRIRTTLEADGEAPSGVAAEVDEATASAAPGGDIAPGSASASQPDGVVPASTPKRPRSRAPATTPRATTVRRSATSTSRTTTPRAAPRRRAAAPAPTATERTPEIAPPPPPQPPVATGTVTIATDEAVGDTAPLGATPQQRSSLDTAIEMLRGQQTALLALAIAVVALLLGRRVLRRRG